MKCFDDSIGRGDRRLCDVFVLEVNGVRKAVGASRFYKYAMCPVVFRRGTDVPAVSGVFAPGATATVFDVELYGTPDWRQWHPVRVKWSMVIGVCRDLGGNIGIAQEV